MSWPRLSVTFFCHSCVCLMQDPTFFLDLNVPDPNVANMWVVPLPMHLMTIAPGRLLQLPQGRPSSESRSAINMLPSTSPAGWLDERLTEIGLVRSPPVPRTVDATFSSGLG